MKTIPVHYRGRVVGEALVDDDRYDELAPFRWNVNGHRYVTRWNRETRRTVSMHRLVLGLTFGDGLVGHHVNGDKLDNRRENLEICASMSEHARLWHDYRDTIAGAWYRLTRGNTVELTPAEVYAMAKAELGR